MHPDIKKFWKDQGYVVRHRAWIENSDNLWWYVCQSAHDGYETKCHLFAKTGDREEPNKYWFDGMRYTEDEMLRLIKLKAFI